MYFYKQQISREHQFGACQWVVAQSRKRAGTLYAGGALSTSSHLSRTKTSCFRSFSPETARKKFFRPESGTVVVCYTYTRTVRSLWVTWRRWRTHHFESRPRPCWNVGLYTFPTLLRSGNIVCETLLTFTRPCTCGLAREYKISGNGGKVACKTRSGANENVSVYTLLVNSDL